MTQRKKKLSFEQGLEMLESMAESLSGGGLSLEESIRLFEEGTKLAAQLQKQLDEQRRRIEIIDPETAEITTFEENQDGVI